MPKIEQLYVVEDDPKYIGFLCQDLRDAGLPDPTIFSNRYEAEEAVRRLPPNSPLCIVLDRDLENDATFADFGGVAVLRQAQRIHPNAIIIAHASNVDVFRDLGVEAAFTKSERSDLINYLVELFNS